MKGEVIQIYESILHILKCECKHFNLERIGENVYKLTGEAVSLCGSAVVN